MSCCRATSARSYLKTAKSSGEQSAEKVCSNSPCPCACRENSPSNSRELQLQKQRDKQRFSLSPCTGMVRVCRRSSLLWSPHFSALHTMGSAHTPSLLLSVYVCTREREWVAREAGVVSGMRAPESVSACVCLCVCGSTET